MELEQLELETATPRQVRHYLRDKFVIIASNRGPVEFRRLENGSVKPFRGAGGVVTAMSTALTATDAVWISVARTREDALTALAYPKRRIPMPPENPQYFLRFLVTDKRDFHLYYNVVSNSVLWYLNHYMLDLTGNPCFDEEFHTAWKEGYRKINRLFAEEIVREVKSQGKKSLIFLQDYHLYLCASHIRSRLPDALIHHFTHSPWVEPDYLKFLPSPYRKEILEGMLACDVVGFHTRHYAENFLRCCAESELPHIKVDSKKGTVEKDGHRTFVCHYPISIDHEALGRLSLRPEVEVHRKRIRQIAGERKIFLRVDRVEPTKNILRGLKAYKVFLRRYPEWHEKVIFFHFLYPSRQELHEYRNLRREIEEEAHSINREFGTLVWDPVHLEIEDNYLRSVAGLMEFDVLVVNPVMDGMNLVAKEGAVLNRRNGVIILSTRAGAWGELKGAALPVNPLDVMELAEAMRTALKMGERRRKALSRRAREVVESNTSFRWFLQQMRALQRAEREKYRTGGSDEQAVPPLPRYERFD